MKARVKATEEIIELCNMEFDENGNEYYRDELELTGDYEPDYWEKLKHQYAGMAMQGILANSETAALYDEDVAALAIRIANITIEKLKEEEK